MLRITLFLVLTTVLLIAGCAPAATEADVPAPTLTLASTPTLEVADNWTIKMTHTGGIMGLLRSMDISADGSYTVRDEGINKTVKGQLSETELAKLQEIVASIDYTTQKPGPGTCADCFVYDLEVHNGEKNIVIQLDDISLPESGMEPLVTFLRGIMESALK